MIHIEVASNLCLLLYLNQEHRKQDKRHDKTQYHSELTHLIEEEREENKSLKSLNK
jgi:hypothetical protein